MSLASKLFEIQSKGLELRFDSTNPHYGNDFASLGAVLDVVLPALKEEGVLVYQAPTRHWRASGEVDPGEVLETTLVDVENPDDRLSFRTPLILDKENMQGLGSAITYARRYALVSLFTLNAEDDDGEGSIEVRGVSEEAKPRRAAPTRGSR